MASVDTSSRVEDGESWRIISKVSTLKASGFLLPRGRSRSVHLLSTRARGAFNLQKKKSYLKTGDTNTLLKAIII